MGNTRRTIEELDTLSTEAVRQRLPPLVQALTSSRPADSGDVEASHFVHIAQLALKVRESHPKVLSFFTPCRDGGDLSASLIAAIDRSVTEFRLDKS